MTERTTDPLEKWGHGFAYRKWLYVGATVAGAIIIAILSTSLAMTSSTFLCGRSCHIVNPQYQSWKRSAHAKVPCYRCHVGSSPISWLRHVVIVQPANTLNWLRQDETIPLNAANAAVALIPSDRCTGCHKDSRSRKTAGISLRERHAEHASADVTCVQCHNRVAHEGAERYQPLREEAPFFEYADYLTMRSGCWRCHSTSAAYRDDRLLDELGLSEFPATECGSCHAGAAPAPDSGPLDHTRRRWDRARHGRIAAKDYGECLVCHPRRTAGGETPDCTGCHNDITMPHNIGDGERFYASEAGFPKWAREHAGFGESIEKCAQCHRDERASDSCAQCHHERYLKNKESTETTETTTTTTETTTTTTETTWPQTHRDITAEVGESCQECHMVEFCAYCHSEDEKPPREFYFNRLRGR